MKKKKRSKHAQVTEDNVIHIILPISPVSKGRPRFTRQGHAYTPQKTRNTEEIVKRWLVKELKPSFCPLLTPLRVVIWFYLYKPPTTKKELPTGRPDLDNYIKLILDAGNGIIWHDDSQIVWLEAKKGYSFIEHIEIFIYECDKEGNCK